MWIFITCENILCVNEDTLFILTEVTYHRSLSTKCLLHINKHSSAHMSSRTLNAGTREHTHTLLPAHARTLTTDGALVAAVRTVTNSVTSADFRYTLSVGAFELRRCTICSTKHKALYIYTFNRHTHIKEQSYNNLDNASFVTSQLPHPDITRDVTVAPTQAGMYRVGRLQVARLL